MAARIIKKGERVQFLSKEALIQDCTIMNRELGSRAAEFLQSTPFKADQHEYPSGRKVNKAMGRSWFTAYNKYDRVIKDPVRERKKVAYIMITWLIQLTAGMARNATSIKTRNAWGSASSMPF
jgi:hypothetical protein